MALEDTAHLINRCEFLEGEVRRLIRDLEQKADDVVRLRAALQNERTRANNAEGRARILSESMKYAV